MFQLVQYHVLLLSFCFLSLPTFSLSFRNSSTHFCHHDDKMALLQLKNGFTIDPVYSYKCTGVQLSYPKTISWKKDTDCCFWDGITCDSVTGHVIKLDLSCSQINGSIHPNSSLFHLRHLQTLNLGYNSFFESRFSGNFDLLSDLKVLNLSNSGFQGEVPFAIAHLSQLVVLDLSLPSIMDDIKFYSSFNDFNITNFTEFFISMLRDTVLRLEMPRFDQITKNLTNLRQLHLNRVLINSSLPQTLANLSSLTSLQLNFCNLQGAFPSNILRLPNLQTLEVAYNPSLYTDSSQFNNLSTSLQVVDFSNTSFTGRLPEYSFRSQPVRLRKFSASYCKLAGTIPSWVWNTTEEVHLDMNQFTGKLPSTMNTNGLSRLTILGLSKNFLRGTIPGWLLTLPMLKVLDLGGNLLNGTPDGSLYFSGNSSLEMIDLSMSNLNVQLNAFSKLKNLKDLDLSNNVVSLAGSLNSTFNWPKLFVLRLPSCGLSKFPDFLRSQQSLRILDLSSNRIQGDIPSWLPQVGKNSLSMLNISHNNLTGGLELLSWTNLFYIDLGFNSLQGSLPLPPPNVLMFFASNNKFHGQISSSFCNLTMLSVLDLSYNQLNGKIPNCEKFSGGLQVLDLRSNRFYGVLPKISMEYCMLQSLDVNNNRFGGKVPQSLKRCKSLEVLDLGQNQFNDTFPHWLDTLPELKVLLLYSNNFRGLIKDNPKKNKHPFPKLQILDLSRNHFSGKLPVIYIEKFKALMVDNGGGLVKSKQLIDLSPGMLNYYHNTIVLTVKGTSLTYEKILTILATLDFSNNKFSGNIPDSVGELVMLIGLNMSHNHLTGHIPPSLANLTSLEFLDLSHNKLTGELSPQLAGLTFLSFFNVSENQLVGHIPQGNQFDTFSSNSYGTNLGLCGYPLPECGKGSALDHKPSTSISQQERDIIDVITDISLWKIIMIGLVFGTILGFVAGSCMMFTFRPVWFARKVDRVEYIMIQSFNKHYRRWQRT